MTQPATKELTFRVTPHEADTSGWKQFKDGDIYKPAGDTGDSGTSAGPQAGTQPQTGDSNSLSLWIMLLLLSLAGIGGTVICGRRKTLNSK